jgi:hypothetical protein
MPTHSTYPLRNTLKTLRRVLYLSFICAMFALSLYECNIDRPTQQRYPLPAEAERQRDELRHELLKLQMSINRQLKHVQRQVAVSSAITRQELNRLDRKLKSNQAKVDKALKDMDHATEQTWRAVKAATENTWQEVQHNTQELAYSLDYVGRTK